MARSARNGLSLIEVLIIIGIILVLICLLLPATRRVRESANRMSCSNNLKQVMLGLESFESTGRSAAIPAPGHLYPPGCFGPGATPEERLSWMVAVLPYLEQNSVIQQPDSLNQQFDVAKGYAGNLPAAQTKVRMFVCPSSKEAATRDAVTHYVALSGIGPDAAKQPAGAIGNGFMGFDRLTSSDMIKDGASNTIALMETRLDVGPWARGGSSTLRGFDPADVSLQSDNPSFGGHHVGGMNAAFADGSVRFLLSSTDPKKIAAAITIAGGEQVDLD
jgi:prepilin-type processing-associated H-X9-DG protein